MAPEEAAILVYPRRGAVRGRPAPPVTLDELASVPQPVMIVPKPPDVEEILAAVRAVIGIVA